MRISIIHIDDDFIVIDKPHGLPSAPLVENDCDNALFQIARQFPVVSDITGKKAIEGSLVHRIDNNARGLLLFARSQYAYDNFQYQQKNGQFLKYYTAICQDMRGDKAKQSIPFSIESRFRPFGKGRKRVEAVFNSGGRAAQKKAGNKYYTTNIVQAEDYPCVQGNILIVRACIQEGYRHQVRVHLAHAGLPIIGDELYGYMHGDAIAVMPNEHMQFCATALEFNHPHTGKRFFVELPV